MNDTALETGPRAVVIQLQPGDLAMAPRLHFWQHVRSRSDLIRLLIPCVVATALFARSLWLGGSEVFRPVLVFAVITTPAVLGFPYLITPVLGGFTARRTFKQHETLQKPTRLMWSEQGVVMQSDYGDARGPWADFRKARQARRLIELYEADRLYRVMPTRCLPACRPPSRQIFRPAWWPHPTQAVRHGCLSTWAAKRCC